MTRNVTTSFRRSAEANFADEVDLCFLTISHQSLADEIRVVWDTQNYVLDGETYIGFPFDINILSDDENPPTAQLAIQNVDPRIGDSVRALTSPPRIKITLMWSGASGQIGAAILDESSTSILDETSDTIRDNTNTFSSSNAIYEADRLFLINVSVDIMQITGTIVGWDYLQRVWPGPRASQQTFPGLFR
jgi:ABC-type tungstate transport system, periplasmic component